MLPPVMLIVPVAVVRLIADAPAAVWFTPARVKPAVPVPMIWLFPASILMFWIVSPFPSVKTFVPALAEIFAAPFAFVNDPPPGWKLSPITLIGCTPPVTVTVAPLPKPSIVVPAPRLIVVDPILMSAPALSLTKTIVLRARGTPLCYRSPGIEC